MIVILLISSAIWSYMIRVVARFAKDIQTRRFTALYVEQKRYGQNVELTD